HEVEVIADDLVVIGNGRIVAQGSKAELLAAAGTMVRAHDTSALTRAMRRAGLTLEAHPDGSVHTDATPEQVGQLALAAHLVLTELRAADGAGLEETFLQLTTDTQREGTAA
ncbi:MAG: ABC transporter ATP-binding protein, partial [Dermatophilaceae bacterium]